MPSLHQENITIKFSHVLHDSQMPGNDRRQISKSINEILAPIKNEVILAEGTVEVIESKSGNFSFLSACNNTQVKNKMNELISRSIAKLNTAR